jgi:hypothetical protein
MLLGMSVIGKMEWFQILIFGPLSWATLFADFLWAGRPSLVRRRLRYGYRLFTLAKTEKFWKHFRGRVWRVTV